MGRSGGGVEAPYGASSHQLRYSLAGMSTKMSANRLGKDPVLEAGHLATDLVEAIRIDFGDR